MEVVVEHVIEDGIEGAAFFRVGEHDDAEIFFGNEHHTGDEAANAAGMADQFAAVIVAQSPAQSVVGEVGFQPSERRLEDRRWEESFAATTFPSNVVR